MRRPARLAVTLAVLPALGLAGCTSPPLPRPTASATPQPSASATRPVQSIAGLALREIGTGTVISVDDDSAGTVWGVLVVAADGTAQELHLSPAGKVLAGPSATPTSADARSRNRARVAAASISLSGAADRMTTAVPKGRVTAIALDEYQDRVVWRGDVTNARGVRQDLRIDAVNGAVLANLVDGQRSSGGS